MKAIPVILAGLLLCMAVVLGGMATPAHAAENPALWKYQVKGDFATVLTHLKHGLEAGQFIIIAEEDLSKGLENNKHLFPAGKWNTIGFDNVTAVHFCSVVFNQEVFNIDLDWSILCPFKIVAYTTRKAPKDVTVVLIRPTYVMEKDRNPKAKEVSKKIEDRIVAAIKEGLSH